MIWTCSLVLGLLTIVSIINQLPLAINEKIRAFDFLQLIPQWTFFAPSPGISDYHLLYRDYCQGTASIFREVPLLFKRNAFTVIWNPNKRLTKALFDLTSNLKSVELKSATNFDLVYISVPYLMLLDLVMHQPDILSSPDSREFIIVNSYGYNNHKPDEIIFISQRHKLST
jgi:hypothetical protein